jgi:hypothetical protein
MNRREFLALAALTMSGACSSVRQTPVSERSAEDPDRVFDRYFLDIYSGFLKNARATAPDYTVCDYPTEPSSNRAAR